MKRKLPASIFLLCLLLGGQVAHAADYRRGPNEFSGHLGFQGGWWDWTPGGAKIALEYGKHLGGLQWLNLQLNFVVGRRWGGDCWYDSAGHWHCSDWGYRGSAIELGGGLKWKFVHVAPPFVPYAKLGGMVALLSYPDVIGLGLAVKGGGGFKYFLLPNVGLGLELNMALGFNFLNHDVGFGLLWAVDFLLGVEVLF